MIRRLALAAVWVLLAVIGFVTLSPMRWRPTTGHAAAERFAAFFALGAALALAFPKRTMRALAAVSVIAVGLEIAQRIDPGRHARVLDALEKLAGGVAGVALTALAAQLVRPRPVARRRAK